MEPQDPSTSISLRIFFKAKLLKTQFITYQKQNPYLALSFQISLSIQSFPCSNKPNPPSSSLAKEQPTAEQRMKCAHLFKSQTFLSWQHQWEKELFLIMIRTLPIGQGHTCFKTPMLFSFVELVSTGFCILDFHQGSRVMLRLSKSIVTHWRCIQMSNQ